MKFLALLFIITLASCSLRARSKRQLFTKEYLDQYTQSKPESKIITVTLEYLDQKVTLKGVHFFFPRYLEHPEETNCMASLEKDKELFWAYHLETPEHVKLVKENEELFRRYFMIEPGDYILLPITVMRDVDLGRRHNFGTHWQFYLNILNEKDKAIWHMQFFEYRNRLLNFSTKQFCMYKVLDKIFKEQFDPLLEEHLSDFPLSLDESADDKLWELQSQFANLFMQNFINVFSQRVLKQLREEMKNPDKVERLRQLIAWIKTRGYTDFITFYRDEELHLEYYNPEYNRDKGLFGSIE